MAGKAERFVLSEPVADRGELDQRADVVRQVGPFMHDVERTRIGDLVLGELLDQDKVEPRAAPAPEEVAGAQHDRAHAAIGGFAQPQLDIVPQLALARGRLHRRVLVEHSGHAGAIVVDIAREHQRRAGLLRCFDRGIGKRQRVLCPAGVGRIERVQDDVGAARFFHRHRAVVGLDHVDALRRAPRRARAHQPFDAPAVVAERFGRREAQPPGGAKHQNLTFHAGLLRPAMVGSS